MKKLFWIIIIYGITTPTSFSQNLQDNNFLDYHSENYSKLVNFLKSKGYFSDDLLKEQEGLVNINHELVFSCKSTDSDSVSFYWFKYAEVHALTYLYFIKGSKVQIIDKYKFGPFYKEIVDVLNDLDVNDKQKNLYLKKLRVYMSEES